jgi:hypothetical protein
MSNQVNQPIASSPSTDESWWVKAKELGVFIIGVLALACFGIFLNYLLKNISLNDLQWNRAIYLFGGVEAIAFSAAGYFFGKEVNRQRAENAEAAAFNAAFIATSETKKDAESNAKLQALKVVIRAKKKALIASGAQAAADELEDIAENLIH